MSGLFGERKSETLQQLTESGHLARFAKLRATESQQSQIQLAQRFMLDCDLSFPIVLKPDFGQRGQGVAIIRSQQAMHEYLSTAKGDILIQEYIEGPEFGVFYMRFPADDKNQIFSITEKTFPVVHGDGISSLERLMMENSRTHYMAKFLLQLHREQLHRVLGLGESFKVVEIGSHCRGAVFLDGKQHITNALLETISAIGEQLSGFYFGRYDIRAKDALALQAGRDFKVLEVNGVTSESTNVYDVENSLFTAYRILFQQWRAAFEIGQQNIAADAHQVSVVELLRYVKEIYLGRDQKQAVV